MPEARTDDNPAIEQQKEFRVEPKASTERPFPYDVRLRREITHRRLAISLVRRATRVISLHLLDAVLVALAVVAVSLIRGVPDVARPYIPVIVATFLLSLNALSTYHPGDARRDQRRLFSSVGLAVLLLLCMVAFPPFIPLDPFFLGALAATGFTALVLGRKGADLLVRQAYARGIGLRRVLMIGSLDEVGSAIRALRDDRNIDQYVVGHVTIEEDPDPAALGDLSDLPRLVVEREIQEVLVTTVLPPARMRWLTAVCFEQGAALFVVPTVTGNAGCWAEPLRVGGCLLLHLHPARLELPAFLFKRVLDVILAALGLVVVAPLLALIALAIKLDSPGPIFYRQWRVGVGEHRFRIWKFRSMYTDADTRRGELAHLNIYGGQAFFKLPGDPRITPVGRFLRRTSLDELPQLLNVLAGEMSLVGPRPPTPDEIELYEPHHFERLSVLPGITGPWQVGGRNLITDFEQVVKMEREYIATWSLLLDIKILLKTFGVVVRGEGAY